MEETKEFEVHSSLCSLKLSMAFDKSEDYKYYEGLDLIKVKQFSMFLHLKTLEKLK